MKAHPNPEEAINRGLPQWPQIRVTTTNIRTPSPGIITSQKTGYVRFRLIPKDREPKPCSTSVFTPGFDSSTVDESPAVRFILSRK